MSVEEALRFFAKIPKIRRRLQTLHDVGLDYIKLGQPATTLSGGEAQRVKLASELSKVATGKTLYILDEPTTGLHFADIEKLLETLQRLVDGGNTMLVIEHNLDVIKQADWVIDLGPEGGEAGGELIAVGTPEDVAKVEDSFTGRFLRSVLPEPRDRRCLERDTSETDTCRAGGSASDSAHGGRRLAASRGGRPGYTGAAVAGAVLATLFFPLIALIAALVLQGGQHDPRKRSQLRTWAWASGGDGARRAARPARCRRVRRPHVWLRLQSGVCVETDDRCDRDTGSR